MAAGQGFKTFTTGEVLTAGDVNGYLMQGINVFTNSTARDAAITAPAEGQFAFTKDNNSLWYYDGAAWVASGAAGDIEGVTAGVGISGGGTSGTVTVTNSMATAIDAKGDLVPGTGADTFARLAVGANGTILTADSAEATGLKWAAPGGGKVVQAKFALSTGAFSRTTDTILDMISVTITPTSNSNNIVMFWSGQADAYDTSGGAAYGYVDITDGTTAKIVSNWGWENFSVSAGNGVSYNGSGGMVYRTAQGTSSKTYTMRLKNVFGASTIDFAQPYLLVMEIEPS